jgi:hypothetical protein
MKAHLGPSPPRKRGSRLSFRDWMPAFAGMTRQPLLHFALLGGLLFAAKLATTGVIDHGRLATASAEDVLLHEALRLGLDRTDPVVRSRLVENMRFAGGGERAQDDDALFAEALALGMAHRDVVARRRLVQALEERLAAGARVSEADVAAYVAVHPERYASPRRVTFEQVFLSADRHPGDLEAFARAVGAQLAAQPAAARQLGEPFLLGRQFVAQSEGDLARGFGEAFARAVMQAPPRQWSGPIRSIYGAHFVRIDAIQEAGPGDPAAARRQAYYALLEERERAAVARELAALQR